MKKYFQHCNLSKIGEKTPTSKRKRKWGMNRPQNLLANFQYQCDNLCKNVGEKMYLTQTNIIRNLTKDEYFQLREMCFFSNCLYNVALYNIRQQYFQDKTYLT